MRSLFVTLVITVTVQTIVQFGWAQNDSKPLFFDPIDNGTVLEDQVLDYDLTSGNVLQFGPQLVKSGQTSVRLSREQAKITEWGFGLEKNQRIGFWYVLSLRWPEEFLKKGRLEIVGDDQVNYWSQDITQKDLVEWEARVETLRQKKDPLYKKFYPNKKVKKLKAGSEKEKAKTGAAYQLRSLSQRHWRSQFGLIGARFLEIPSTQINQGFRFCLSQEKGEGRIALCSKRYKFVRKSGRLRLVEIKKKVVPQVRINDRPVTLKGRAIFLESQLIKFSAILNDGSYYEFVSRPKYIQVVDLVENQDTGKIEIIGFKEPPIGNVRPENYEKFDYFSFLNFMPTIGDLRKFWKVEVDPEDPHVYLVGYGGAPFKQPFRVKDLPPIEIRPQIFRESERSTYTDTAWISGQVLPSVEISSNQRLAKKTTENEFEWQFAAPKAGTYNRSLLQIEHEGKTYNSYYEVYRGYPGGVSGRLTGVVTNDFQLLLLGEVAGEYWFNSLFGLRNYYLSNQRWGVAGKHFQALAGIGSKSEGASLVDLSITNVDLKYRLTPGVWGRDPSVGLIFGTRQVGYLGYQVPMLGGGVFWARSMPKIFDRFFNIIPWFRYAKWVDMEFIYYPVSLDTARFRLGPNMALNFHGKIAWGDQFYGEGGFGLKVFQFDDLIDEFGLSAATLYGTFGIGYSF